MKFWLMAPLLCLWPEHRKEARFAIAENLIALAWNVMPHSLEKLELSRFIVDSWMGRRDP